MTAAHGGVLGMSKIFHALRWAERRHAALLAPAVLALACTTTPALHAAPELDSPVQTDQATSATQVAGAQAEQAADLAQARQQADAAFAQAMQALQQQQWLQAELLLERTLMFYPAHAEALLQLALLLAQRDDPDSAMALIQVLLDDPATPAAHRQRLQTLLGNARALSLAAAVQATPTQSPPHTVVSWGLTYSHNPLAATQAKELVLTLPQGNVTVPLQQRSGEGATGQLQLYHRWSGGLELQAATQASSAANARTAGRFTLVGPLGQGAGAPLYWSLAAQQTLDGARRHAASLLWQAAGGQRGNSDEQPALYGLGVFDEPQANRRGFTARVQKAWPGAPAVVQQGLAWAEYEHAQGPSPNAVRAGWQGYRQLAPRWLLHASGTAQADSAGYSPLLANNKPRRIFTGSLALERQFASAVLGGQLALNLNWSQRWSNLPLFAWKDYGLGLQWQRQWR